MTGDRPASGPDLTAAEVEDARRVWRSPRELGAGGSALASIGQGTVVILMGFDLATVVLLMTSTGAISAPWEAAIACFGVSAAMFALTLAFIATAEDYAATPDERIMYHPEARVSAEALEVQRGLQRQDDNLLSIYFNKRILPSVTVAVIGTLVGLALVVLGKGWSPGPVIAAIAAVVVAVIYLIDWVMSGANWWLFPRPILPAWTEKDLANKYSGQLTNSGKRKERLDRLLGVPIAKARMGEAGYKAMLGASPGGDPEVPVRGPGPSAARAHRRPLPPQTRHGPTLRVYWGRNGQRTKSQARSYDGRRTNRRFEP